MLAIWCIRLLVRPGMWQIRCEGLYQRGRIITALADEICG